MSEKPIHGPRVKLGAEGRWMHVQQGDEFTDDPAAVTCSRCRNYGGTHAQ